jgi:ATP-dependent DNA helicase RecG
MELSVLKLTKRRQQLLEHMQIFTVEDVLKHYPLRYEQVESIPFDQWQKADNVCFEALIASSANVIRLSGNRTMTRFRVISWNEEIEVTLFNRPWPGQFQFGSTITIFGVYNGNNKVTATNYNFKPLAEQSGLRPIYPLSKDMKQSDMQAIIKKALEHTDLMEALIPERYQKKYRLLPITTAYAWIHQPKDMKQLHAAIRTLKYEEFLCFQCVMQASSRQIETKEPKVFDRSLIEKKIASFGYTLTPDQNKAVEDVLADMASNKVMFRLVQGDVGCGKTIVAELALYACQLSGRQAAFLAPTELLARQHYANLQKLGIEASLYVAGMPAKEKKAVLEGIAGGNVQIAVGTHALFQEKVEFANLGLVVADEQQRFGVKQRRALLAKGERVDFLMMSATPIPRTYAHFLYGDIALSSIHTMPPNRKPVLTKYIPAASMKPVLKHVLAAIKEGRQVYVICPMIDDNPEVNLKAAMPIYEGMQQVLGASVNIALLHGKMKAAQKDEIMNAFSRHEYDILVSTTVIEVGIDVPNANMMVIYDAHRFGLSTLHQLRGRTARSSRQGECFLLSSSKDAQAIERLKQMETMLDGFSISQYDLAKRGPGDILGVRQSGLPSFVLGDFEKDPAIMDVCIHDAKEILLAQKDEAMLAYVAKAVEKARYID